MSETMFAKVMKEFASAFVSDKRNDGKVFYKLKDDAPAWLQKDAGSTVMREIHQALDDRLPNDWVYEAVSSLADAFDERNIEDEDSAREATSEIADGLVDIYNADRLRWLSDHLYNADIVDEACKELGVSSDAGTIERIGVGQFYAYERLANGVIDQVQAEADSRDEEEESWHPSH